MILDSLASPARGVRVVGALTAALPFIAFDPAGRAMFANLLGNASQQPVSRPGQRLRGVHSVVSLRAAVPAVCRTGLLLPFGRKLHTLTLVMFC